MVPTSHDPIHCYVIGSDGSGKTSLCYKLCGQNGNSGGWMFGYQQYYITTNKGKQSISTRYAGTGMDIVTLNVWDSCGGEDYDTQRQRDYGAIYSNTRHIDVIIILFSVVNENSLDLAISKFIPEVNFHSPQSRIILAGNKIDLREKYPEWNLSYETGLEIAKENNAEYVECCCVDTQEHLEGIEKLIEVVMEGRSIPLVIKQKSNCIIS